MYVTVIETSGTASVLVYSLAFRIAVSHEVVSRCREIIWHVGLRQSASAADKVTRAISKLSLSPCVAVIQRKYLHSTFFKLFGCRFFSAQKKISFIRSSSFISPLRKKRSVKFAN